MSSRHLSPKASPAFALVLLLCAGCSGGSTPAARPAASGGDQATVPHGDHNPRHGGVVLMHGDLHYEVVLRPTGHYEVYFSDARRAPLPATIASTVTITITRKNGQAEVLGLQIAADDESWTGDGKPVDDPTATARIAYEIDGQGYWIDVPVDMRAQK